jgi:hypothetical protein
MMMRGQRQLIFEFWINFTKENSKLLIMKNILDKLNAEQKDRLTRIKELKEQLNTPQLKDDPVETRKIQKKIRLLEAVVRSVQQVLSDEGITDTTREF